MFAHRRYRAQIGGPAVGPGRRSGNIGRPGRGCDSGTTQRRVAGQPLNLIDFTEGNGGTLQAGDQRI
ncbi:MAG: hypothetical protein QGF09_17775, partial [Rhodospirillales bacterium]|nr:hypothetical protein [Rhodospirillales bacterium]